MSYDIERLNIEVRYIPKPAGLIAILDRSAPSEVNAPPIAATLAERKACSVWENFAASIWLIFTGLMTSPPNTVVCAAAPIENESNATKVAMLKTLFIFLTYNINRLIIKLIYRLDERLLLLLLELLRLLLDE